MGSKQWSGAVVMALAAINSARGEAVGGQAPEQIVVVGSRGAPRLASDTSAPVDVFTGEDLARRGFNELTKALAFLSPSFNYPRASSGPSTQGARPATLRGLGPDQVLVLINGHRRHASSLITFNNTVGRGTVPIDFNTIPVAAIERIEVLRDGAAAQYGSDAIAGVINIVLREDAERSEASLQYGETERGEGESVIARIRTALPLGAHGFVALNGEFNDREGTNAAEIDPRYGRITSTLGDSPVTDRNFLVNAGMPFGGSAEAYGFVTYGHRDSDMSPLFRGPEVAPTIYPAGFLPEVSLELEDVGGAFGIKGQLEHWQWDVSDTFGRSAGDYRVANTINTSLGAASPTRFEGGGARYAQNVVTATIGRELALLAATHLTAGLEHRRESYELESGDPLSYAGTGAQGFPGFNPPRPIDVDRDAVSAFIDAEFTVRDGLNVGLAARYEDYSDFGDELTGKLALFWRPMSMAALRATASSGFRAPSLQQQFFSTVTSQRLPNGTISNVGTFAVSDPVSRALGASALEAETSTSFSAGVVLTPWSSLSMSVDAYRIDIDDRIALSENIQGAQVNAILLANGITNASVARFFTNAADTRSEGIEATLRWHQPIADATSLTLTAGYGSFDNDTRHIASNPVLPAIALLGANSIALINDAQPSSKVLFDARLDWHAWVCELVATRFGSYQTPGVSARQDSSMALDLTVSVQATSALTFTLGVINATDEYPSRIADGTGRPYSEASPLGFNGREYFARFGVEY